MSKHISPLALSILAASALSAPAAITYVDAQEGANTYATGSTLGDTSWIDSISNTAGVDDNLWSKRFGGTPGWTEHNGGDVIQGMVSGYPNNLAEITTEVTGLANGTYDVWVFFWEQVTSDTQNWVIDAGLTSGSLNAYSFPLPQPGAGTVSGTDSTSPVDAGTLTFDGVVRTTGAGGNQTMYGVLLGQTTVSGGSSLNVYVDKLTGTASGNRTIFDGIGYELIPEPSSSLLLALGSLGLLVRRRR